MKTGQLAGKADANLFISVHSNSTVDGLMSSYNGTEVMYDELKSEEGFSSRRLAQICLEETTAAIGSKNNGVTYGNSIYIIRNSEVPVALINKLASAFPASCARCSKEGFTSSVLV